MYNDIVFLVATSVAQFYAPVPTDSLVGLIKCNKLAYLGDIHCNNFQIK